MEQQSIKMKLTRIGVSALLVAALMLAAPAMPAAADENAPQTPPSVANPVQVEIKLDAGIKWKKKAMTYLPAYGKKTLSAVYGEKLGELPVFYKPGYLMKGWYTKKKGGKKVSASTTVRFTKTTKLYAHWKKASTKQIAKSIAKRSKKQKSDRARLQAAADAVAAHYNQGEYTNKSKNYSKAKGVFVDGKSTCAGAARALGMVLGYMGYKWEHVNPNKYTHQWCKVYTKSGVMWADGGVTNIGIPGAPYAIDEIVGLVGKGKRRM
jgi:uncharacterized repeat protein (TIGR02543 family)